MEGLTAIVKKNWKTMIPAAGLIGLGIYGAYEAGSAAYDLAKTGTNEGLVDAVKGVSMMAAAGIGLPIVGRVSNYFRHKSQNNNNNYQPSE